MVLYSEFTDTAALTHYATHAEHMRVRDELEGLRISRHQVDYVSDYAVEVPDNVKLKPGIETRWTSPLSGARHFQTFSF